MLVVHHAKNCRVLLDGSIVNESFVDNGYA